MDRYKHPLDLPDEHMRMIGIISSQWEYIEAVLERAVAEIMQLDRHRIAILTTNLSFQAKCDILLLHARPLSDTGDPDHKAKWKKFTSVCEEMRKAYLLRCKFVHAKWMLDQNAPDEPPRMHIVQTNQGKLTALDNPVPIEVMYEAAQSIWQSGEKFSKLLGEFDLLQS